MLDENTQEEMSAKIEAITDILDGMSFHHVLSTLMTTISVVISSAPKDQQVIIAKALAEALVRLIEMNPDELHSSN
jgi:hypothetical protein